jgi:hypothetical protein
MSDLRTANCNTAAGVKKNEFDLLRRGSTAGDAERRGSATGVDKRRAVPVAPPESELLAVQRPGSPTAAPPRSA